MSWKFVFNPSGLSPMAKIAHIARIAEEAGYEFFTVNGAVFLWLMESITKPISHIKIYFNGRGYDGTWK